MREIKFRIWCKQTEEMHTVERMGFEEGELWYVEDEDRETEPPYFMDRNDSVLMQYTGLKDKNGREIYEGDLYRYTISYEYMVDGISQQHHVTTFVKPVVFNDGAFYHGNDLLADVIEHDDTFEYVGNIYENPELIDAQ